MEAALPHDNENFHLVAKHVERAERIDILKDWSIAKKKSKQHGRAQEDRIAELDAAPLETRSIKTVMYSFELANLIRPRDEMSQELKNLQLQLGSHLTLEQAEMVAQKLNAIDQAYIESEILINEVHYRVTGANDIYSQYRYTQEEEMKHITADFTPENNTVLRVLWQMANHRPTPHIASVVHRQSLGIVRILIADELGREIPIPPPKLDSVQ